LTQTQDKSILATAVPRITDDFNSLSDIGWYGSSYMLTLCACQMFWGRIYTFYPTKATFIAAVAVFEIGSALCGAAPSSSVLILGRAIAGAGSAGISNGTIIVIIQTTPLEKRPMFTGLVGAVFGIAGVVGPLLGGAFTEHVSWKWCFYINLPFGGLAVGVLVLVLHLPSKEREQLTRWEQFQRLDPIGTVLFLPSVVCLLLALQWGGTTYAWSSWRPVLLLILAGVLFIGFFALQIWKPDTATLPMRILKQRTVAASTLFAFTIQAERLLANKIWSSDHSHHSFSGHWYDPGRRPGPADWLSGSVHDPECCHFLSWYWAAHYVASRCESQRLDWL
jgi:MFS family permease